MKIIKVSPRDFDTIWSKLIPSKRIHCDLPTPNLFIQHLDLLIVLEGSVRIIEPHDCPDLNGAPMTMGYLEEVCRGIRVGRGENETNISQSETIL